MTLLRVHGALDKPNGRQVKWNTVPFPLKLRYLCDWHSIRIVKYASLRRCSLAAEGYLWVYESLPSCMAETGSTPSSSSSWLVCEPSCENRLGSCKVQETKVYWTRGSKSMRSYYKADWVRHLWVTPPSEGVCGGGQGSCFPSFWGKGWSGLLALQTLSMDAIGPIIALMNDQSLW